MHHHCQRLRGHLSCGASLESLGLRLFNAGEEIGTHNADSIGEDLSNMGDNLGDSHELGS